MQLINNQNTPSITINYPQVTIQSAKTLQNEIHAIWQKIGWENLLQENEKNSTETAWRCLNEQEITTIEEFSKDIDYLQKDSKTSKTLELDKLKDFAVECTKRLQIVKEKSELNFIEAKKRAEYFVYIKNFNGLSSSQIFEVAKIAILTSFFNREKSPEATSKITAFYDLDLPQIIEIIKALAVNCSATRTRNYIEHFAIKDPTQLFGILKVVATNQELSLIIQEFNNLGEDALVELAKISASVQGYVTVQHLKEYGIKDSAKLFEIGKIAISNHSWSAEFLMRFDFFDENQKLEIAKFAVEESPTHYTANPHFILPYLNPNHLFEVIKILAFKEDYFFYSHLKEWGITNQDHLFELAMIKANREPEKLCDQIKRFKIDDPVSRYRIAKQALIKCNPIEFAKNISSYKLTLEHSIELFLLCCEKIPNEVSNLSKKFFEKFKVDNNLKNYPIELMLEPSQTSLLENNIYLGGLLQIERNIPSEHHRTILREWIGFYLLNCQFYSELDKEAFDKGHEEINSISIIESIAKLRNPLKRYQLTTLLFNYLNKDDNGMFQIFNKLEQLKVFGKKNSPIFRLLLTPIIYFQASKEADATEWNRIFRNWECVFSALASNTYKDAGSQMTVINSLYALIQNTDLEMFEKGQLLLSIFGLANGVAEKKKKTKIINRNLRLMEMIFHGGHGKSLKQFVSLRPKGRLLSKDSLQENLLRAFHGIVGKVEIQDFAKKFDESFLKARQPNAFFSYANKLQVLPIEDKKIMNPLIRKLYIDILEGHFQNNRYEAGNHLSTIFSWKAGFKEDWRKGSVKMITENNDIKKIVNEFNFKSAICEKIIVDKHLGENPNNEYSILLTILQSRENIEASIDKGIKELQEFKSKLISEESYEDEQRQKIDLQISLIGTLDLRNSKSERSKLIKTAQENIPKEHPQFLRDLKDLELVLNYEASKDHKLDLNVGWTVEETDSWEDLLLSGTEVNQSCQSIYSDSKYNKCLLNYILDGKNRIVVLKDTEKRIHARILLRLLWDDKLKKPVLYRERRYIAHDVLDSSHISMVAACGLKAQSLGIPIVQTREDESSGNPYPNPLHSLNGISLYEYVDAQGLGITGGKFTISGNDTEVL